MNDYVYQRKVAELERAIVDCEFEARVDLAMRLAAGSRLGELLAAAMLPATADGKVMADA